MFMLAVFLAFINKDIPLEQPQSGVDVVTISKPKRKQERFFKENLYRENPREQKNGSIAESVCRVIIQNYTGKFFHSVRPDFLRSPKTNCPLELDGYNEELKMAFEYNGRQHYEFPNHCHKTIEEFHIQQENDRYKEARCRELDIHLIVIPYTVKDLDTFIREELQSRGVL